MAIWQYPFEVAPKNKVLDKQGNLALLLNIKKQGGWINIVDSTGYWKRSSVRATPLKERIDKLLPREAWSSSSDSVGWKGDTENGKDNDCFMSIKNEYVASLSFRVDLRSMQNINDFLIPMLDICADHDLILIGEGEIVMEPFIKHVIDHLKNSRAARFIKDPKDFLDSLENEGHKQKNDDATLPEKKQRRFPRIWKRWIS